MRRAIVGFLLAVLLVAGFLVVDRVGADGRLWAATARDLGVTASPVEVDPEAGRVDRLGAGLSGAITKAQAAAAAEGVELVITSGWRSAARQQELYEEAIAKYGSPEAARQWVLPPGESEHVRGGAIDVGPPKAARWLENNGVRFGLCRVYDNEPWHFELLAPNLGQPCPARLPHA